MRTLSTFDIFLASPSDVTAERELVVSIVREWNISRGRNTGAAFEVVRWEDHVFPDFGKYPQDVVNEQIGSSYDVFVGIFWTKVGTATPGHASGSVEELNRALDKRKKGDPLPVAVYFKSGQVDISSIDIDQLGKLRSLKQDIAAAGGLYRDFSSDEELRNNLNLLLDNVASKNIAPVVSASIQVPVQDNSSETINVVDGEEDVGLFEAGEQLHKAASDLTKVLEGISNAHMNFNGGVLRLSEKLAEANLVGDQAKALQIVDDLSDELNRLTSVYTAGQGEVADKFERISAAVRTVAQILASEPMAEESRISNRKDLEELEKIISEAALQFDVFQAGISSIPRLTTRINVAKKQLRSAQEDFRAEMESMLRVIRQAVEMLGP